MESLPVMTVFGMTFTGVDGEADKAAAIVAECSATVFRVCCPYKCWLPVTNHTSSLEKFIIPQSTCFLAFPSVVGQGGRRIARRCSYPSDVGFRVPRCAAFGWTIAAPI